MMSRKLVPGDVVCLLMSPNNYIKEYRSVKCKVRNIYYRGSTQKDLVEWNTDDIPLDYRISLINYEDNKSYYCNKHLDKLYFEDELDELTKDITNLNKILEFKNGILVIETDHPGRIQLFQMYKNYIQTGINRKSPDLKVKNILFRLKKNEKNIKAENVEEIIREKLLADNIDDEFEKKYPSQNENKSELPDDIKVIFERMKNGEK